MKNVKIFWAKNWKWLIGTAGISLFLVGFNFGIIKTKIDNKPSIKQTQKFINKEINKTILPRIIKVENSIQKTKIKEKTDLLLLREIKFNLKALLNSQHIKYIELK